MLHHLKQARLYGCAYHALYALTGDEAWLEHVEDVSTARWQARLVAAGLMPIVYFADCIGITTVTPQFWAGMQALGCSTGLDFTHLPLLVTVAGRSALGRHLVAVAFPIHPEDSVFVSDSARPELLTLEYDAFLASEYAQALEVEGLISTDLAAHPFESGAAFVSTADPTPYAM